MSATVKSSPAASRPSKDGRGVPEPSEGLTTVEAARRLKACGPNAMPDTAASPWRSALGKLWAPVPWMLEAAVVLEVALGDYAEAAIIAGLLVFNAALGLVQEGRATATLVALRSRLAMNASVRRDGRWAVLPAAQLVPGDVIKLSVGGVVGADARITSGEVLLDHSMLTGESAPVEGGPGVETFAGATVRRGEAAAVVTAIGVRTKFGSMAELVRTAHVVSSQQKAVLRVVRNLAVFSAAVIAVLLVCAVVLRLAVGEVVPLVLTAILASIPVALPATFTLASAIGAQALTRRGVLPTRLSAVDEAGTMDVLCVDKTGTLTRNALTVSGLRPMPGFDAEHVLALAGLACSDGGMDPVDAAIRAAAKAQPAGDTPKLTCFTPFDPATKMAEATATTATGESWRILNGAFAVVAAQTLPCATVQAAADALQAQGCRVLAVAAGPPGAMKLAGLIALDDPPRDDAAVLVRELRGLGVRTVMATGDAAATAMIVARAVGLDGPACPPGPIPQGLRAHAFAVFAGVLPEDKFTLVKAYQRIGHTVGMCGDGANDAPALRQAQVGISVSTATDVAKSAAGVVLTEPGLAGIVAAVREGRVTFQRIQTYALNSICKKIATLLLLSGLLMTGQAVLTPLLMVILMIAGDFLAMSLTTDAVRPSPQPNAWRIRELTVAGAVMGAGLLAFCVAALAVGRYALELPVEQLRTLAFLSLVFGSQAMIYALRERGELWALRPSAWLAASSAADVLIASGLAVFGVAMAPLPAWLVAGLLGAAVVLSLLLDVLRRPVFARLKIA